MAKTKKSIKTGEETGAVSAAVSTPSKKSSETSRTPKTSVKAVVTPTSTTITTTATSQKKKRRRKPKSSPQMEVDSDTPVEIAVSTETEPLTDARILWNALHDSSRKLNILAAHLAQLPLKEFLVQKDTLVAQAEARIAVYSKITQEQMKIKKEAVAKVKLEALEESDLMAATPGREVSPDYPAASDESDDEDDEPTPKMAMRTLANGFQATGEATDEESESDDEEPVPSPSVKRTRRQ
ncbi:hypothetical protein BC832DRAFT_615267 [Gaertneriomyces semiglobifer]|nr:hypothetical protein BC832DRAFT_615267 [Gaertneriomyces semiglobifer]